MSKFLVDAQLPRRLANLLQTWGYDAIHTLDLPEQNKTPDEVINDFSVREQRIVISKDADFVNSFLLQQRPYKLLLVSTGNIHNRELEQLFAQNITEIADGFEDYDFIELDRNLVTFHQ